MASFTCGSHLGELLKRQFSTPEEKSSGGVGGSKAMAGRGATNWGYRGKDNGLCFCKKPNRIR